MSKTQIRKPDTLPDEDDPWIELQEQITNELCALLEEMGFDPPYEAVRYLVNGITQDQIKISDA